MKKILNHPTFVRKLSLVFLFGLTFFLKAIAEEKDSVKSILIVGKNTNVWNFYPGQYSFLRVELDKPGNTIQNYILYVDNIPIKNVMPILPIQGPYLNYRFDFENKEQIDAWKTFFHAIKGKNLNSIQITVGPEGGIPLSSSIQKKIILVSPNGNATSIIAGIILCALFLCLLFFTTIFHDPNTVLGTCTKKPYSLSRIQFGIWNILILYSLIYIYALTGKILPIPAQLLILISVSGAQFIVGWALTKTDDPDYQISTTSGNLIRDILTSDVDTGLHRYQNILWSVAIWIYFIYSLIINVDYPVIDAQLLILTGFTSAIYAYGKSKETTKKFLREFSKSKPAGIGLPDLQTDEGVLAHLFLAECKTPAFADYNAKDSIRSFKAMKATVDNRLGNNPGQFGAPGAKNYRDVITGKNQFEGFTKDGGGNVGINSSVMDRIRDILKKANAGTTGKFYTHVSNAIEIAKQNKEDEFKNLTVIDGKPVIGGVYSWRTEGSGSPGGRFIAIPESDGGVIMGNQFYTLTT